MQEFPLCVIDKSLMVFNNFWSLRSWDKLTTLEILHLALRNTPLSLQPLSEVPVGQPELGEDADPGMTEVEDARKRLAGLKESVRRAEARTSRPP